MLVSLLMWKHPRSSWWRAGLMALDTICVSTAVFQCPIWDGSWNWRFHYLDFRRGRGRGPLTCFFGSCLLISLLPHYLSGQSLVTWPHQPSGVGFNAFHISEFLQNSFFEKSVHLQPSLGYYCQTFLCLLADSNYTRHLCGTWSLFHHELGLTREAKFIDFMCEYIQKVSFLSHGPN